VKDSAVAKRTVLYIEDEEDDILFMRRAFLQAGLDLILQFVPDGKQAVSFLAPDSLAASRQAAPEMILLDLNLPVLSGFEVLLWIRNQAHLRTTPVVIFSSSGRPEDRRKAHELGAADYVLKPASGYHFVEIVRDLPRRYLKSLPPHKDSAAA
jgi:CheY-like chemotaxis protein